MLGEKNIQVEMILVPRDSSALCGQKLTYCVDTPRFIESRCGRGQGMPKGRIIPLLCLKLGHLGGD